MIKGIDVSRYQAGLNFSTAKNMGFQICIIKATESTTYTNTLLHSQVNSALNSNMEIGFYHFFRNSGKAEDKYFVSKIKPYLTNMTVKPTLDVETTYSYSEIINFINYVEDALCIGCMIYVNYSDAKQLSLNSKIAKRALWVAYYGVNNGNYYEVPTDSGFVKLAGQQYSSANYIGSVNVDTNLFNENVYLNKGAYVEVNEDKNETTSNNASTTKTYTVVSCDTLSAIAKRYETTISAIA